MLPHLCMRAGVALVWSAAGVLMLVSEIRHVEAAVVNLESYGGHETVLLLWVRSPLAPPARLSVGVLQPVADRRCCLP